MVCDDENIKAPGGGQALRLNCGLSLQLLY